MCEKVIAYYRVSTKRQGQSGLGLEGQKEAVARHVAQNEKTLVAEFVEIESGKRNSRPQLALALQHAKACQGQLVVAKLDRLSRNLHFLSSVMESGVSLAALDAPHATRFTLHILSAVAEHEGKAISERTRTALAACIARGIALGSARPGHWEGREELRQAGQRKAAAAGAIARHEKAEEANALAKSHIERLRQEGKTLVATAEELNSLGLVLRRGGEWTRQAVCRLCKRYNID